MQFLNPRLTKEERRWFSLLFAIPCKFSEIMHQQVEAAEISRDYTEYYLIINLLHSANVVRLPRLGTRTPINMIVQHDTGLELQKSVVCYQEQYKMECIQGNNGQWPTEFILHIFDGVIQQLEIINVDGSPIDRTQICFGRADYSIAPILAF